MKNNSIENNILIYKYLSQTYEKSVIKDLETVKDDLVRIFEDLLKDEAQNHQLITKSSINKVHYFSVKGRVKKVDSFSEKLIRKDIGISFLKEFGSDINSVKANKANAITRMKKLDDIIGLRIVTELREDAYNVIKLLKDNLGVLKDNDVVLHNIESQPEKMRNGLEIFRIKCEYQDLVSFELQIKSKIDEAWGEMDHTIFYKDHSSSPIKPTIQKTMNNIGVLFEKIETLLYDLRSSSQEFELAKKFIDFENNLHTNYSDKIIDKLGYPISFGDISEALYTIKTNKIKGKNIINAPLLFDFINFDIKKQENQNTVKLFHGSHKLLIIEALFHNVLKTADDSLLISDKNYENIYEDFENEYLDFLNYKTDLDKDYYKNLLNENIDFIEDSAILYDIKRIKNFKKISDSITNALEGNAENTITILKNIFFISSFSGKAELYVQEIQRDIDFNILSFIEAVENDLKNNVDEIFKDTFKKEIMVVKQIISISAK